MVGWVKGITVFSGTLWAIALLAPFLGIEGSVTVPPGNVVVNLMLPWSTAIGAGGAGGCPRWSDLRALGISGTIWQLLSRSAAATQRARLRAYGDGFQLRLPADRNIGSGWELRG